MSPSWPERVAETFRILDVVPFHPLAFALVPVALFLLRGRGKGAGYLLCFSLFFFYVCTVLTFTIFKFAPSSYNPAVIELVSWPDSINLIPKLFSDEFDPRSTQVYGNFLLGVPFGLGLPFVARTTPGRAVLIELAFAAGIEVAQLLLGLLVFRIPYRVIDIDDVLLVLAGTLFGQGLFLAAARLYRRIGWAGAARLPVWDHIHAVLLAATPAPPILSPPSTRQLET